MLISWKKSVWLILLFHCWWNFITVLTSEQFVCLFYAKYGSTIIVTPKNGRQQRSFQVKIDQFLCRKVPHVMRTRIKFQTCSIPTNCLTCIFSESDVRDSLFHVILSRYLWWLKFTIFDQLWAHGIVIDHLSILLSENDQLSIF